MLKFLVFGLLLTLQAVSALPLKQQLPLYEKVVRLVNMARSTDLISELKASGIIPDVLSQFTPKLSIAVSWPASNTSAEIGNTLSPSAVQSKPNISFVAPTAHDISQSNITALKSDVQLTLALTDPDAPSRENPEWSQYLHWLVTGVPLVPLFALSNPALIAEASKNIQELIEWKPPGPPPKTGKHRYVFVALAPANQTTEKLELSVPTERQHWGYGGCKEDRRGLKDWAEENGLVVVGANFVYAQNDEQ